MTRHIHTEILIQASPQRVWQVLTDFAAYPQWNPFIVSLQGRAEWGERLTVRIRMGGGKEHVFKPVLLQATPPTRLRWLGRLGVPGLFDGEHDFALEEQAGATLLRHSESFQGYLVPLLWRSVEPASRAGFEAMNRALKARAEAGPG
ncbi:MAG TPA: SRPBCC domain-containing protein [Gammaproteobacteria bacterium]|nr:SRPBCC domain-containing protein [Gammaproteobacteria bacterium]